MIEMTIYFRKLVLNKNMAQRANEHAAFAEMELAEKNVRLN